MKKRKTKRRIKGFGSAYLDLMNSNYVFDALLGHGMFADKLPPCFCSVDLLDSVKNVDASSERLAIHSHVEYRATKHTLVPRQFGIPHPKSYWLLCNQIRKHWGTINLHIGKPSPKFNHCHVRRINGHEHIFEMGGYGLNKFREQKRESRYHLGCRYVVETDISTCFPSIYSHSISWAANGLESAKAHQCTSFGKRKKDGKPCDKNENEPCTYTDDDLWANDLDAFSRAMKHNETNGLLIGPHSSNIVSEIILTQIDCALQANGFKKVGLPPNLWVND